MAHLYLVDHQRLIAGETVRLTGDEAHHAAKAARLRVGERVQIGDGRGHLARAEATSVDADAVELVVVEAWMVDREQPEVWLAQSLAKQGRDEQAVEQATEVGVDRVIPLSTERAVVKWDEAKKTSGHERWQRIVREATKQSLQPYLADVEPLRLLTELLERADIQFIALDHRAEKSILDVPIEPLPGAAPIVLAVGPEGGWSDGEKEAIVAAGGGLAKLGSGVLRASSAGPIALALMRARLRQW